MTLRSLPAALILGFAAANLQAQTAAPAAEKCGTFSNVITIQVVPCDPPTAAEILPQRYFSEEKFQNKIDWTEPKRTCPRSVRFETSTMLAAV